MNEFEKRMRDKIKNKKPFTPKETKGDKLRKDLKKALSKKTKTFESPMKMERKKEGFRSKNPNVKFANEMEAMTKGLKTLTSEGPGRVKVGSMAKGGRAMLKGGGICKKGMNKKAVGKNS